MNGPTTPHTLKSLFFPRIHSENLLISQQTIHTSNEEMLKLNVITDEIRTWVEAVALQMLIFCFSSLGNIGTFSSSYRSGNRQSGLCKLLVSQKMEFTFSVKVYRVR